MASNKFDPDKFLAETEGFAPTFDPGTFIEKTNGMYGEPAAPHNSGLTPETALNKSPVDVEDRLKLSLGNQAGRIKYLKTKFEDVQQRSNGDFVVKKNDRWYRVDPEGLGDGDAWEQSKELLKDAADLVPLATLFGSEILGGVGGGVVGATAGGVVGSPAGGLPGAAAGATIGGIVGAAGGRIAAAGAHEMARTSLGRVYGTYEATDEEQLSDTGFEMMLALGGEAIGAGVKPVAKVMGSSVKRWAKNVNEASGGRLNAPMRKIMSLLSGVGEESIDTAARQPGKVATAMRRAQATVDAKAAKSINLTTDNVLDDLSTKNLRPLVDAAPRVLSASYEKGKRDIITSAPQAFRANVDDIVSNVWRQAADANLGVLKRGGKALSREESLRLLAESAGRLPKGVEFKPHSFMDLQILQRRGGEVLDFANDAKAVQLAQDYLKTLDGLSKMSKRKLVGKKGVEELLKFNKVLNDASWALKIQADELGLNQVNRLMSSIGEGVTNSVAANFEKHGMGKAYAKLQNDFVSNRTSLAPFLETNFRMKKRPEALNTLYGQLVGKAQGQKNVALAAVNDLAERYTPSTAGMLRQNLNNIRVNEAAKAFTPIVRPGMFSGLGMAVGASSLATSAATGEPGTGFMTLGGAAALTSPRLAFKALQSRGAMRAGGHALVQGIRNKAGAVPVWFQGKEFLQQLPKEQLQYIYRNPNAQQAFLNTLVSSPEQEAIIKDSFIMDAAGGQSGGR